MRPAATFFANLSRVSSSGRLIPEIDGLRCVAIAAVIAHHLQDQTCAQRLFLTDQTLVYALVHRGFLGVQLFFAISGFILALPFAERYANGQAVDLRHYYMRRLRRIEPPYLICMLLLATVMLLTSPYPPTLVLEHLSASLLYVHNLCFPAFTGVNPVAWSLEIELQWYVLAPLVFLLFKLPKRTWRLTAFLGPAFALATFNAWPAHHGLYRWILPYHLPYFLVGVAAAELYRARARLAVIPALVWDLVALAAVLGVLGTPRALDALLPLWMLALITSASQARWTRAALSHPVVATLGGMCYTLYLYHKPVITMVGPHLLHRLPESWSPNMLLAAMAAALGPPIICLCTVLFVLFERPFMNRPARRAPAAEPAMQATAG